MITASFYKPTHFQAQVVKR